MENIRIRQATEADLQDLLAFEQGVINAERPFDPTLRTEDTHYYDLHQMIAAPHVELLVAEIDGELIGSGYARIEDSKLYLQHQQHAYLGFMYVKPAWRGRGINQLLIGELEKWIRTKGISELRLEVYYENASAIKAYEKIGFIKHMVQMRKRLDS